MDLEGGVGGKNNSCNAQSEAGRMMLRESTYTAINFLMLRSSWNCFAETHTSCVMIQDKI